MVSDREAAERISKLMLEIFAKVDESVDAVKKVVPAVEAAAYQKAAGRVAGAVVMDVLEPLYEKHPELRPHNWDE